MSTFVNDYLPWVLLALAIIGIVIAGTWYAFHRRHYIDAGPRKGEALRPGRVRQENPPDRQRS